MDKPKVLVVDDEEVIRLLLTRALGAAGFEVNTARNGEEGKRLLETIRAHVLLTDKNMPPPDGVQLAKYARKVQPHIAVMLMTAYPTSELPAELGVDECVSKPFELKALVERIRRVAAAAFVPAI